MKARERGSGLGRLVPVMRVRNDCAIGSAFDDEVIFLVDECFSTPLS